MKFIEALNWSYATKEMTGKVVPIEKLNAIVDASLLCPTSSGLQPFHIILISKKELKKRNLPIAINQPVIAQSLHLMVFAAWDFYTEERINKHFTYINEQQGIPDSTTDEYRKMLLELFEKKTPLQQFTHAAKQSYIGVAYAIIAAANEQIQATPMKGLNLVALDEVSELNKRALKSAAILALGCRHTKADWLLKLKKGSVPLREFVTEMK